MAAQSSQPKTGLKGTITFSDATGSPVTLALLYSDGAESLAPLAEDLNEPVILVSRSQIVGFTRGAPRPPTLSFVALVGNLVGDDAVAPGSPLEFIFRKGAYAANVSTLGANRKSAVDVTITIEGTDWGDSADETIVCENVVFDAAFAVAMDGNKLTFTGTVLGAVIIDNDANTVTLQAAA